MHIVSINTESGLSIKFILTQTKLNVFIKRLVIKMYFAQNGLPCGTLVVFECNTSYFYFKIFKLF